MAPNSSKSLEVLRFGDDFELDLRAYELRRSGRPLRLERIPMELLLLLIERRGDLVTRDQIIERIWGKDAFLDTESGINAAIRKIRQVLRDNPEQPRFVQTVTGRGYRFIAPMVEPVIAARKLSEEASPPAARPRWTWIILGTAILLATIGLYAARTWSRPGVSKLTERDTIVLADFVNTTTDPVFDDALKQALTVVLTQSPFLNVASDVQVSEMLHRMGRSPKDPLTGEVAREVCLRMGGKAILIGSISSLGSHYVVGLQALSCSGGAMLATSQAEVANKESVLKALGGVTSQVRSKVGESLSSLEKYDFPVDTTTQSLEALKAFSVGQKAQRDSGEGDAIPFLRHAIQLDPDFALAYAVLGRAYENVGEDGEAVRNFTQAFQLRERLSEREKYHITTLYHEIVTGDLEKAKEAGELWTRTYPRDGYAREKLATVYADLGETEKSYTQAQEALRLDPDSTINVFNMVVGATTRNSLDDAARILQTAQSRGLDGAVIHESMYALAFLRGDSAEMDRQVTWTTGKAGAEDLLLAQHSDTEAYYGRMHKARELSLRAVESARREQAEEIAATCEIVATLREIEIGNVSIAGQGIWSAMSSVPSRDVKILAALALARSGNAARARALVKELESENQANTLVRFYWVPAINASLELRVGNSQGALSQLRVASRYELSETSSLSNLSNMYPAYIRGQAYLLAHNGSAAAAEFKKLLDHRGIVQNSILGALSLLQLARAEVMVGDMDGARKQYSDFLSLWKDADPDVPILKQAQAEYAKLQPVAKDRT
jgi:DNA-binding winged helix-turn-helix (wHTH) protein/tetratricopeptide (TPR) repeat protein